MTLKLYVIDSHEQALDIWRQQQLTNAKLLHVDFHCDQRGLLVNQKKNLAYPIWTRFPKVDEGNFLKHAIVDGIIASVRWVHDIPGGRQHDIKTLKFHTDFSAIIHRLIHLFKRSPQTSYRLETCLASQWIQIQPGEILDIDWDFFAAKEYAVDSIPERIEKFFDRDFEVPPQQIIVCHSPEYCHPTDELFEQFVDRIKTLFDADLIRLPKPFVPRSQRSSSKLKNALRARARKLYHLTNLSLRRLGIY